jgi:hypothetical protein
LFATTKGCRGTRGRSARRVHRRRSGRAHRVGASLRRRGRARRS